MRLIKDGRIVENPWYHAGDEEPLPDGPVTVSFTRWRNEPDLAQREGSLGLRLHGEDLIEEIAQALPRFDLIVLEFPALADGRGFSLARLLRERYGYGGELRARGDFIRDQMFFLARVGVNAFELTDQAALADALPALTEFSVKYQAASDEKLPLYVRRSNPTVGDIPEVRKG